MQWLVHPDIRQARTLPASFYTTPAIYDDSIARVLTPSWQLVGDATQVRLPGQLHPFRFIEGCVEEPLLLARDATDALRCLSNVCTHRGNILVPHACTEQKMLRCRYHGRRFGLDGQLQHMPAFEGVVGYPAASDHLTQLPLHTWGPLLFTAIAPHAAFEQVYGAMLKRMAFLPLQEFKLEPAHSRDYLVQCHWALYVENYLEGFHIPFVHASLNEALNYGNYRTELFDYSVLQLGISKGGEVVFDLPAGHPDHGQAVAAYYWWVYPNLMFNFYPWGLSINLVKPQGPTRTRVQYLTYIWHPSLYNTGAGTDLDRVEREDEAIVEAVQQGLRSRLYTQGRYSPTRETGPHHFHRLLAASMNG